MDVLAKVQRLKKLIAAHTKTIVDLQDKCKHDFELTESREVYLAMDYYPVRYYNYTCKLCGFSTTCNNRM